MKFQFKKSETSLILLVFIQDSSVTTGAGLGSLDQTSSIVGGYVKRDGTGVALAVDENVTTEGTYEAPSTAAQVRIGTPANMPTGWYELHFHNDLFTTADYVSIGLGVAGMVPLNIEIQLTDFDMNTALSDTTIWAVAMSDLAQGAPSATASVLTGLNWLYEMWRNKTETTNAKITVYKDDGSTELVTSVISDNATTFTKSEFISGV